MRSSPPAMESAAEGEDLTTGGDQMDMVKTSADPDEIIPTQVIPSRRAAITQWRVFPDSRLGGLPTLEDLLVEVSHIARSLNSRGSTTQVWDGNIPVESSPEEWKD